MGQSCGHYGCGTRLLVVEQCCRRQVKTFLGNLLKCNVEKMNRDKIGTHML